MATEKIKVLFVCMGNICRSPTAQGVFQALVEERKLQHRFEIDSAGTHAYHVNEAPDLRAQRAARDRGIELNHLRARKVIYGDFEDYDHILVMDDDNYEIMIEACPDEYQNKVKLLMDYAPNIDERHVPDPYYGGKFGFERVLNMVEEASAGFLKSLDME